jgi:hypothetical protein
MKFTITLAYAKDTETVFKVLTDKSYLIEKFEFTGAKNISIPECGEKDDAFVITRKLDIPANPPGFAKKFVKAWNTVTATDTWHAYDKETKTGTFVIHIKGMPVSIDGDLTLKPTKQGCQFIVDFDARVHIPIIGNKIAGLIESDTRANLEMDYQFTKKYLENL